MIGRLKLSGNVGLLYKKDADRLIENIPSDLDIFTFNREFANDPERAQRLLLYGAYPNLKPAQRQDLLRLVNNEGIAQPNGDGTASDLVQQEKDANEASQASSNDSSTGEQPTKTGGIDAAEEPVEIAAANAGRQNPAATKQGVKIPGEKGDVRAAYGETNGLYPQLNTIASDPFKAVYDSKKADPDSLKELQKARADIAQVERNRRAAGATTGIERQFCSPMTRGPTVKR